MASLHKFHVLLGGALTFGNITNQAQQTEKPNILMIILDDAGYNDFGFMGSKEISTPSIDSLARKGIILTDGHVSASVSGPSRAGILTGRYQQRNGYECNLEGEHGLGLKEQTIADLFAQNGYSTACIGKWHQGDLPEYHPNRRGFDHFYGFIAGSRSYFYRPEKDDRPGSSQMMQSNGKQIKFEGYLTDVLAQEASRYIREKSQAKKPFMLYLAFNAVHTPMEAKKSDLAAFAGHPRQKLAAMTQALDRGIGQVIQTLQTTQQLDNTLIFFVSDNGGAHNNQSSNFPLKGFKGNKFEGGHRVPYFIVYGDRLKGKYEGLCSSLDMLPTAAAAAGIATDNLANPLDGVNLLPYLTKEKQETPHEVLYWRKDEMAAIRMGDYKLIRVKGVGERLYNLRSNPQETIDLCTQEPKRYQTMMATLKEWEKGLVNPLLWNEGAWNEVTKEIHRSLMNNKKVTKFTP